MVIFAQPIENCSNLEMLLTVRAFVPFPFASDSSVGVRVIFNSEPARRWHGWQVRSWNSHKTPDNAPRPSSGAEGQASVRPRRRFFTYSSKKVKQQKYFEEKKKNKKTTIQTRDKDRDVES